MINRVVLVCRLTRDVEVRKTQTGLSVASFTVACDRRTSRSQDGNQQTADFINCVAFGKSGEFIEKYFRKGMKANICGRIQTGSYTNKDGNKVYTTDVLVEEIEFGESKSSNQQSTAPANPSNAVNPMTDENGFMNIPDGIDEELPFA